MDRRYKILSKTSDQESSYLELRNEVALIFPSQAIEAMDIYAKEKTKILEKLVEETEKYCQVLSDECSDLVGMAAVHGWKSGRVEEGKKCRIEIAKLKSILQLKSNKNGE